MLIPITLLFFSAILQIFLSLKKRKYWGMLLPLLTVLILVLSNIETQESYSIQVKNEGDFVYQDESSYTQKTNALITEGKEFVTNKPTNSKVSFVLIRVMGTITLTTEVVIYVVCRKTLKDRNQ